MSRLTVGEPLPAQQCLRETGVLFQGRRCLCTCRKTFRVEWPCVFSDLLFSLLMVTLWIWVLRRNILILVTFLVARLRAPAFKKVCMFITFFPARSSVAQSTQMG